MSNKQSDALASYFHELLDNDLEVDIETEESTEIEADSGAEKTAKQEESIVEAAGDDEALKQEKKGPEPRVDALNDANINTENGHEKDGAENLATDKVVSETRNGAVADENNDAYNVDLANVEITATQLLNSESVDEELQEDESDLTGVSQSPSAASELSESESNAPEVMAANLEVGHAEEVAPFQAIENASDEASANEFVPKNEVVLANEPELLASIDIDDELADVDEVDMEAEIAAEIDAEFAQQGQVPVELDADEDGQDSKREVVNVEESLETEVETEENHSAPESMAATNLAETAELNDTSTNEIAETQENSEEGSKKKVDTVDSAPNSTAEQEPEPEPEPRLAGQPSVDESTEAKQATPKPQIAVELESEERPFLESKNETLKKVDIQSLLNTIPKPLTIETATLAKLDQRQWTVAPPKTQHVTWLKNCLHLHVKARALAEAKAQAEQAAAQATQTHYLCDDPLVQSRFQVLLFRIGGLQLAVPLAKLGGIFRVEKDAITPLFGKPDWFMGMAKDELGNLQIVNTAKWLLKDKFSGSEIDDLKLDYIILLDDSRWGLACTGVNDTIFLEHHQVKWNRNPEKRPWLGGILTKEMCVLLDVDVLVRELKQLSGKPS